MMKDYLIGLDVGSTTVKAVVVDARTRELRWKDYQKHETRQGEKALDFLRRMETDLSLPPGRVGLLCTGSGAGPIARAVGGTFVQEVNAVCAAVRRLHPEARSVIELGGQDAKIVVFREDPASGAITTLPSMNDKCAAGTGATLEKVAAKVGIRAAELGGKRYLPFKDDLVHIAAKCGVFAETDVVGYLKAGLPEDQILASLFDAVVAQNLSVLARGYTLYPKVLLLGGPNTYIRGMVEAWRHNIPRMWEERGVEIPSTPIPELIQVPENAQYFAALGAVEIGLREDEECLQRLEYRGPEALRDHLGAERTKMKAAGGRGLWKTTPELDSFLGEFHSPPFQPARWQPGKSVRAFLGIDGGSTSTKAILLDPQGRVVAKAYQLSRGNPIQDTMDCVGRLREQAESAGSRVRIEGVGATGYARDVLAKVIRADSGVVETVAHTMAARHFYPEADVIVDVGGQDIKIILLRDGRVADFRLNTQCSAGNGYFLQSTAEAFGIGIENYAETAFQARKMPAFGYGCAVFMQSDIVNFQKEGWEPEEILSGLAAVLPKNIWLYVSKIPNLRALGRTFILQGGTQYNLAAVKAQVDFIRERFSGSGIEPRIIVHRHCGEAGAIGAALEAMRSVSRRGSSRFIGLEALAAIRYEKTSDERTRCHFCKNNCSRTFVDVRSAEPSTLQYRSAVPLKAGWERIITGFSCDRGTVESPEAMQAIKTDMDRGLQETPNTVQEMARDVFRSPSVEPALPRGRNPGAALLLHRRLARIREQRSRRRRIRLGIPRVLNLYSQAPFFLGYLQSLGVSRSNIEFSRVTNSEMYREGAKRGAIDPCFPSKVCIAHVHDLLERVHSRRPLQAIFFPMVDSFPTFLRGVTASRACPTVVATPEAVKAAFTREGDVFARAGLSYLNPLLNLDHRPLLREQLFQSFGTLLGLDRLENDLAVSEGLRALEDFHERQRARGREVIDRLVREKRLGFVVLARPYHNDEGVNHEILLKLQRLGYPILSLESLPVDRDFLEPLFREDLEQEVIRDPREISDVWATPYSENTSRKIWAAKVVARHPNLVALELSSFKCGHDATCYTVIERILSTSGTPFFTLRDLDENDPGGAIQLRLQTIDYFLKRERERLLGQAEARSVRPGSEPETLHELVRFDPLQALDTPAVSSCCGNPDEPRSGLVQLEA